MLLEVDRVASFYGDFQALFDVTLAVDEGETVAVIGANGAGKSTLLRTVAGLRTDEIARASVHGRQAVFDQVFDTYQLQVESVRYFHQVWKPSHRTIVIHNFH